MATDIRPEITKRSKYYISRHRYYELKHFCLQYFEWKREYQTLSDGLGAGLNALNEVVIKNSQSDLTSEKAVYLAELKSNMEIVETVANDADREIGGYIFKAVTEGISFTTLKTSYDIPCEKDMFYDRYRRFFWMLDKRR